MSGVFYHTQGKTMKKKLYEVAVLHTDSTGKTGILIKPTAILTTDEDTARMKAAVMLSTECNLNLDDCEVLVRLFQ